MIAPLLILVVVGIVVVAALRRRHGGEARGVDAAGVRRFFQYLLLLGLLIVTAIGSAGLLGRLLGGGALVRLDQAQLARSLTFVLVGGSLFAGLALWSRRRIGEDPTEVRSFGWAFYVTVVSLVALVTSMFSLHSVLSWLVGNARYDGMALGTLLVWVTVWALHWVIDRRLSPPAPAQIHLLAGSLAGLVASFLGLSGLVASAIDGLLGTQRDVLLPGISGMLDSAATLAVGLPVWAVYWLAGARHTDRTPLWHTYVFLFGVAGGLISALVAGATGVYQGLVWLVGEPTAGEAARHFGYVPDLAGAASVGMLVWWYHRALVAHEAGARSETRRVYEYVVAGIGLLAGALGLTTLLVAFFEAVAGTADVLVQASARNTLLGAVTALLVGGPVWWLFWRRIQGAEAGPERSSPTRRIYLFSLFGVGGVAAVIALITAVYIVFEDTLAGRFGAETLRSTRVAIGVLVATAAIAAYHWAVYRQDAVHAPPHRVIGPRYVLLIGAADDHIGSTVARRTGGRVQAWARTDEEAAAWSEEQVMDALAGVGGDEVVVVSDGDGLQVIPIHRP